MTLWTITFDVESGDIAQETFALGTLLQDVGRLLRAGYIPAQVQDASDGSVRFRVTRSTP